MSSALIALCGLGVIILNRRFARAGVVTSREFFGRKMPEGGREYRFSVLYSRVIVILVGTICLVGGTLGALGIDWRHIYR